MQEIITLSLRKLAIIMVILFVIASIVLVAKMEENAPPTVEEVSEDATGR